MKKNFDPFKNLKLDPYEQELEDAFERGELKHIDNMDEEIKRYRKIFQEAAQMRKKEKRVNIRVNAHDLDRIRAKAIEHSLPYQTLISTILHHYAKGKIKVDL